MKIYQENKTQQKKKNKTKKLLTSTGILHHQIQGLLCLNNLK